MNYAADDQSASKVTPGRVSVPIATYDRVDVLINRTLPSLLHQSYGDIEVIVVGDGTPEPLFQRLERVTDPRLRLHRLPNRQRYPKDLKRRWMVAGTDARNLGASLATGEWILWMSDDDVIHPQGIELLLEAAQAVQGANFVSGGFQTEVSGKGSNTHLPSNLKLGFKFPTAGMPALLIHHCLRGVRWNRFSHLKRWNRPSDYDLLERLGHLPIVPAICDHVIATVPLVHDTGLTGSEAFALEELRRQISERNS